jgi:hypothetical protein
MVKFAES